MNLANQFYSGGGAREAYIVLSFGQSNEGNASINLADDGGYQHLLPTSPVDFNTVDPTIKIAVDYNKPSHGGTQQPHTFNFRWEDMEGDYWTSGDGVAAYGWEQTYLRRLRDRVNDTIYFFRDARGGVSVGEFQDPAYDMYNLIVPGITFVIDSILAEGKVPVILFANWGQAESNHGDTGYSSKLESVIDYIRAAYPAYTSNIPFMLRKMSAVQTLWDGSVVNSEMDVVAGARSDVYTYTPDDMTPAPTGYPEPGQGGLVAHYTGETQLRMGDYLFDLTVNNGIVP